MSAIYRIWRVIRDIKHNTFPWNLCFNMRSGAVVMSPESEGLIKRCRQSRCGPEPHSAQWYFIFFPVHFCSGYAPGPERFVGL